MSDPNPVPRSDPTGFPCPHERVREYQGAVDRSVKPAVYVQPGVCLVCGYGVHRQKSAAHVSGTVTARGKGDHYTPWSVFPGSSRDPLIVRPAPKL
jgi:hypothetical protein